MKASSPTEFLTIDALQRERREMCGQISLLTQKQAHLSMADRTGMEETF